MTEASRRPHPAPLEYITPTQHGEGDDCLWRLGFSRDPTVSGLSRSSPASALGSVAHEVMSKVGGRADFGTVWRTAVSKAEGTLAAEWAPATPPSPENWPGWSLTKIRMGKFWQRSTQSCAPQSLGGGGGQGSKKSGSPPPLPWREQWLRHPKLPLAGRPDLVERVQDEVWVVDLKTGLKQGEPTPAQRSQLLFYCGLVEASLGVSPTGAAVQTTGGQRHSFAVDPAQVHEVMDAAVAMLDRVNAVGAEGLSDSDATPSVSACSWCAFKPACGHFFDAYDETWSIPHALLFEIQTADVSPHGVSVEATVRQPDWRAREKVHILGFPFGSRPEVGETWGAVNFAGRSSSAVALWNTTVFKWD